MIARRYLMIVGLGLVLGGLLLTLLASEAGAATLPRLDTSLAQATPAPASPTPLPPTPTPVPPTPTPVPTPAPSSGSSSSGLPVVPIFLGLLFLGIILAVLLPVIRSRLRGR